MNPTDLRPIGYEEVQPSLKGNRLEVFRALQQHGPATGSELALAMNWPPTSVLPRVSELYKQGWAQATGIRRGGRHVFLAVGKTVQLELISV